MKLSELKSKIDALIEQVGPDCAINVACSFPHATLGSSPMVPVTGINAGIDWDHGRVVIHTERKLFTDLEIANHASRAIEEIACWIDGQESRPDPKIKLEKVITNIVNSYKKKVKDFRDKNGKT